LSEYVCCCIHPYASRGQRWGQYKAYTGDSIPIDQIKIDCQLVFLFDIPQYTT
jgi:hypothetical protein